MILLKFYTPFTVNLFPSFFIIYVHRLNILILVACIFAKWLIPWSSISLDAILNDCLPKLSHCKIGSYILDRCLHPTFLNVLFSTYNQTNLILTWWASKSWALFAHKRQFPSICYLSIYFITNEYLFDISEILLKQIVHQLIIELRSILDFYMFRSDEPIDVGFEQLLLQHIILYS